MCNLCWWTHIISHKLPAGFWSFFFLADSFIYLFILKEHWRSCSGWESSLLHIHLARGTVNKEGMENANGALHFLNSIIESPTKKCYADHPFAVMTAGWWRRWSGQHTPRQTHIKTHTRLTSRYVHSYPGGQLCSPPKHMYNIGTNRTNGQMNTDQNGQVYRRIPAHMLGASTEMPHWFGSLLTPPAGT